MDTHYQPIYRQAAGLQSRMHQYTQSMAHTPEAYALRKQMHSLTNDLATNKQPRAIQNRLEMIQSQVSRASVAGVTAHGVQPMLTNTQRGYFQNQFNQMHRSVGMRPRV